jgi:hypothetical protein
VGILRAAALLLCCSCGSSASDWTAQDTTAATHIDVTAKGCEELCEGDAGCSAKQAAGCLDGILCSAGSMLHRHGANAHVSPDAGCEP